MRASEEPGFDQAKGKHGLLVEGCERDFVSMTVQVAGRLSPLNFDPAGACCHACAASGETELGKNGEGERFWGKGQGATVWVVQREGSLSQSA